MMRKSEIKPLTRGEGYRQLPRAMARVTRVTQDLLDAQAVLATNKAELYRANDKKQHLAKRFKQVIKQNRLRSGDWQELDIVSEDMHSIDLRIAELEMQQRVVERVIKTCQRDLKWANDRVARCNAALSKEQ